MNVIKILTIIFIIIYFCKHENALNSMGFLMLWNYFCSLTVQVTPMLQINFSSEEEAKNRFSNGRNFGFPIFFFFFPTVDLQVTPTKFGVNWPFSSGEEAKK